MIVSGELENVPLLEVLQVLSYSTQSGALSVESSDTKGTVLFREGGIVCAESPSTRLLLAKAAREVEPRTRRAFRRVQALACLTELLSIRRGIFKFTKHEAPVEELAGVDVRSFYASGAMATAELLLVLATAVNNKETTAPMSSHETTDSRAHPRYSPTLIRAELNVGGSTLAGYLTNLSIGGAFFQGDALPERDKVSELKFELPGGLGAVTTTARVAWARLEGRDSERGVGLAFEGTPAEDKEKLGAYIDRFQRLATDMDLVG